MSKTMVSIIIIILNLNLTVIMCNYCKFKIVIIIESYHHTNTY